MSAGKGARVRRAVFLDRDGTINVNPPAGDFVKRPDDLRLLPGVPAALGALAASGYALVVFSNQSGVGRGVMTAGDVERVNARVRELLAAGGVSLDGVYYCPHTDADCCACRKPSPGMLIRAAGELGIDLAASWAVGDSWRDIQAGMAAGCRTVLVYGDSYDGQRSRAEALGPAASVPDLAAAADVILGPGRPDPSRRRRPARPPRVSG